MTMIDLSYFTDRKIDDLSIVDLRTIWGCYGRLKNLVKNHPNLNKEMYDDLVGALNHLGKFNTHRERWDHD